jgi:hypothetical protein
MMPMADRLRRQRFFAFCAYEAIEPTWERVKQLVDSGRPMIYVERWMDGGDLRVSPGLRLNEGGYRPGADFRKNDEETGFSLMATPGFHQVSAWARASEGSEADAARRFHAKRDGCQIVVDGFGLGRDDHIEVTDWNQFGVGHQRSIYFGFESSQERAEREGKFLDALAAHGDWTAEDLKKLAERARYEWEPALDLAAGARGDG